MANLKREKLNEQAKDAQPKIDLDQLILGFRKAAKEQNQRLWELEQRIRRLEAVRDREFNIELGRRLQNDTAQKACEGEESGLSELRHRLRDL